MNTESSHNRLDTRPVIGVFGHYGNENLGDESIIEALVLRIRKDRPNAEIRCFSAHPRDTAMRYGVIAYPIRQAGEAELNDELGKSFEGVSTHQPEASATAENSGPTNHLRRWIKQILPTFVRIRLVSLAQHARDSWNELGFLRRSFRRLDGVDALIVAGSNQFLDNFGGPWGYPYTLLKWSILARFADCRLAYVSVGAGPLDAPLSRLMVRAAIRFADYLSYRDSASKELIEGGRLRGFGPVFPDLAHSLPLPPDRAAPNGTVSRSRMRVGINPMPVYDKRYWYKTDDDRYQTYVSKLAEFADALVSKNIEVFFFPTQPKDINVAIDVIRALRPAIAAQLHQPEPIRRPRTVVELIDVIRDADIVVATRYHGTLLALHAGRPVIAICYQRKARDLMREAGQDAYAVDFDLLDVAGLIARVERLETRGLEEIAKIRQVNERYGAALDEQYRALIAQLLPEVSAGGQGVRPMPPAG